MVSTQVQIIEKMLGRRLTDREKSWIPATSHIEMLRWAENKAKDEGRKPGYAGGFTDLKAQIKQKK